MKLKLDGDGYSIFITDINGDRISGVKPFMKVIIDSNKCARQLIPCCDSVIDFYDNISLQKIIKVNKSKGYSFLNISPPSIIIRDNNDNLIGKCECKYTCCGCNVIIKDNKNNILYYIKDNECQPGLYCTCLCCKSFKKYY